MLNKKKKLDFWNQISLLRVLYYYAYCTSSSPDRSNWKTKNADQKRKHRSKNESRKTQRIVFSIQSYNRLLHLVFSIQSSSPSRDLHRIVFSITIVANLRSLSLNRRPPSWTLTISKSQNHTGTSTVLEP
jgi:hypothetical protein